MKLYKLSITVPMVVLAKDAMDAKHIANRHLVEEARNMGLDDWSNAVEIVSTKDLPEHWDEQCLPYRTPDPPDEPMIKTILAAVR